MSVALLGGSLGAWRRSAFSAKILVGLVFVFFWVLGFVEWNGR
jgi:hypothetical protein